MSDGLLTDKILEAFGAEKFDGTISPGSDWSPNMYKGLYILPDAIMTMTHFNTIGDAVPYSGEGVLDVYELVDALKTRHLGCLEGIYVHQSLGGADVAAQAVQSAMEVGRDRIHEVGAAVGVDPSSRTIKVEGRTELPGSEGWEARYSLEPEHYPLDKEGGKLWSVFDAAKTAYTDKVGESAVVPVDGEEGTEDEVTSEAAIEEEEASEAAEPAKVDSPNKDKVYSYYADYTRGSINKILREYSKMFASGYQVLTPAGILLENENGYGVLGHIAPLKTEDGKERADTGKLIKDPINRNLQFIYADLKKRMNLEEVPVRSIEEISSIISSGKNGNKLLYFPYKMMEYAFGRRRLSAGEGGRGSKEGINTYQEHSKRSSWEDYAKAEVFESLKDVMLYVINQSLAAKGLDAEPESPASNEVADSVIEAFQRAFLTCILVSKFDLSSDGDLVAVKIRVLDYDQKLPRNVNLVTQILNESHGSIEGSSSVQSYPPVNDGTFVEYNVELDTKLANAEPIFAYKALQKIKEQGGTFDYDHLVFGLDANDKILQNGDLIDLKKKLAHVVIAGSRAGKGVWTYSILAPSLIEKLVLYLDNKPDMASLFKSLGANSFAVNGANIAYDKEHGTDFFQQFINADSFVKPDHIPEYVATIMGGKGYRNIGAAVYARALMLVMGILAARVEVPSALDSLGGDKGIVIVVDELANANANLMSWFSQMNQQIANTGFYQEAKEVGLDGRITADKPPMSAYWFTHFYYSLRDSISKIQSLSNAGLKNSEADKSDVFVLTQEPPDMITSSGQVTDMFRRPNKNSMAISGSLENPGILPSLALVGGVDAFMGYDRDNRAFLAQGNPQSKSYPYLNEVSRCFGYLKQYGPEVKAQINTSSLAETAVYYKPLLLFSDGSQDEYFVKNALEYAQQAGIEHPEEIIARNSVEGDPTTINPAVGFRGYMHLAGLTDEQIEQKANKSGEMVQWVVDKMGYTGTWLDFLTDMRPDWIFNIQDVIDAVKGTPLTDTVEKRMADFLFVYPEAFPGVAGTENAEGDIEYYSDGVDMSGYHSDGEATEYVDQGDYEDNDFDGETFAEPEGTGSGTMEGVYGSSTTRLPTVEERAAAEAQGEIAPTVEVNWSDPNAVHAFNSYMAGEEAQGNVSAPQMGQPVGNGYAATPSGKPDNYHPAQPVDMPMAAPLNLSSPASLADLVEQVTNGAYSLIGGPYNLRSIRVIDGTLILNNVCYKPTFEQRYLDRLPTDLRAEAQSGNLARLFNWKTLDQTGMNLSRLSFSDFEFVYDYVGPSMGWGNRVSVERFFKAFKKLNYLSIGSREYNRGNYRNQLTEDNEQFNPSKAFWAHAHSVAVTSRAYNFSKEVLKTSLTASDMGPVWRIVGVTGGLLLTGVTGVAHAGASASSMSYDMRHGISMLRDAFRKTK